MQLNGLKFEHMCYGKNEELKSQSVYFSDTQNPIEAKNQVKDLGVTLDVDMTYDQHIQNQINKVKAISSWIYRTFKTRDPDVMLTLWKSLAIPHLGLLLPALVAIKKMLHSVARKPPEIILEWNSLFETLELLGKPKEVKNLQS